MHPGNAAVVPRSSDTLLLGPVEANVAELRRRTPAWDEHRSSRGVRLGSGLTLGFAALRYPGLGWGVGQRRT
jgi:hypothetical protein